jgi:DNA-binding FadR family transcriptional regulator
MARQSSPENLFEKKEKKTAVDQVIDSIKKILIEKRLAPGDLLPSEQNIAESLGVGRGSVREALKILSAFGIVDIKQGDGSYIATSANKKIFDPLIYSLIINNTDSEELIRLRSMIETGVLNTIIDDATDEDIQKLVAIHGKLEEAFTQQVDDLNVLNSLDLEFHRCMATITHNHLIENIYNFVIDIFAPTINARHALKAHRKIIDALIRRDSSFALEAEKEHIAAWRASKVTPG